MIEQLIQNKEALESRVQAATRRAGKDLKDIRIIAVSKTKPAEVVQKAYQAGFRSFGENRVQEILAKQDSEFCRDLQDIEWHLIGHLQTNKVRQIIDKVALIHSVDRMDVANEIQRYAEKKGIVVNALMQVNIAKEDSKSGFYVEEIDSAIQNFSQLNNIHIQGLMTIAPFRLNPEENRKIFRELYKIYIDIDKKKMDNVTMSILSMGMSNDFEVAIEEGANMIRVGTFIFGERI